MLRRVIQHVATLATVALLVGAGPLIHRRLHFRVVDSDDAVVHYTCDEGSGTTLTDSGSKGLNATHNMAYAAGHVGAYCVTNNRTKYAYTASTDLAASWSAISICFWLYHTDYAVEGDCVLRADNGTNDYHKASIYYWADYLHCILYGVGGVSKDTYIHHAKAAAEGAWAHICVVWDKAVDSGKIKIFVNKVEPAYGQQQAMTVDTRPGSIPWYFGAYSSSQYRLNGKLDDIRIYNYAIDADKRAELYAMGPPTYTVSDAWDADFNGTYIRSAAPGYVTGGGWAIVLGGSVYYWTKDSNTRWIARGDDNETWMIFSTAEELIDQKTSTAVTPPTGTWDFDTVVAEN
jgi:hypothetical protein